jgi:uncharacterized protein YjbI with pentapeptide repeats
MTIERKKIRQGIVGFLSGATLAGANVTASKPSAAWEEDAPGIFVWTSTDIPSKMSDAPLEYRRELEVLVEVHASRTAETEAEDLVDDVLAEIEELMEANRFLPTVDGVRIDPDAFALENVDLESSSAGRTRLAGGALTYRVVYFWTPSVDGSKLDDFNQARLRWEIDSSPAFADSISLDV